MAHDLRAAQWRKSSFSSDSGECVEVASNLPGVHIVRDSKRLAGPVLVFTTGAWSAFVTGVKAAAL
ncbi:DUF397 domain-containing protein [Sphaerisporangium aureirubrum]|uniref:DUF397 domain-containing protein n=1 Tax=Sphaerisporangium aureirubrum TaxID=1544736 RepID=A0ABW1NJJ9_9ACTN